MIIKSLWAENVLKYSLLDLNDVPGKGLIAVIGDNESGKSTIGESICFALFGRTFSLEPKDLGKIIRWGESRCSIKLDFTTPDGQGYQVARFLDELGNHGASVSRAGEAPMVRGVAEVEAALKDIIGFGYTELIESFYLAQREITTPHPHSFAVKAMAGVDVMEKVAGGCRKEIERFRVQIEETASEEEDICTQIDALDLQEGYLEELEGQHTEKTSALDAQRRHIAELKGSAEQSEAMTGRLREATSDWLDVGAEASFAGRRAQATGLDSLLSQLAPRWSGDESTTAHFNALSAFAADTRERLSGFEGLRSRADAYREQLERLLGSAEDTVLKEGEQTFGAREADLLSETKQTGSKRRTARVLTFLFLLLALACWGATGLLGLAPDSPQAQQLAGWLSSLSADWQDQLQPWFIIAASTLTVLFLAFMGRGIGLGSRLRQLARSQQQLKAAKVEAALEVRQLSALDHMPMSEALAFLGKMQDDSIAAHATELAQGAGRVLIDPQDHDERRESFRRMAAALENGLDESKAAALAEIEHLHESVAAHSADIARLDEVIAYERERARKHLELNAIAGNLRSRINELLRRIKVRDLAADLLKGAIHYISQRFNTEVRNLAADSLPKFTNDRYEHLQIDENLKVKAFSNEKRNFMDLDEISSGTQRQIMLAVRLALSQKLVNSVIQGPQMLFLDEPFAFFDESRTASALAVLPQVSGDFTQIWVTSQTFPAQSRFDLTIQCNAKDNSSPLVKRAK
jgi:DNA repair exonuclease SbcCD ATPase subunit